MRTATLLFYYLLGGVAAHKVPSGEVVGAVDTQLIYDRGDVQRHDVALPPPLLVKGTSTSASSSPTITPHVLGFHKRQAQPNATTTAVMNTTTTAVMNTTTTTTTTTSSVSIPATAAAGGLSYLQPAATDAVSYYKVASGQLITFAWTYTSLYVTPTSLTFEARCTANSFTYPVGPTTGIPASQTSLVWDPYAYAQSAGAIPFAQASYTLRVYDERGINAAATGGYFNGAQSVVYFALYSPAAYTPLASGWTCVACSAAMITKHLSHPLVMALPVTIALVLIGGAGVLYR
ncbi:BQ5605_C008g05392 [Microbotryum silenes-dioicae]|uniref:BQ5605_C008g05392 protein n=1 Tax=Microbotryum silenes-dioicae TaxID=796604 RepID=A0A2X0MGB6_9BASI|nr:BQ5605_C008g05392 [Microbotryum silenes-dioicae]